jgi:hypothetical protein
MKSIEQKLAALAAARETVRSAMLELQHLRISLHEAVDRLRRRTDAAFVEDSDHKEASGAAEFEGSSHVSD